MKLTVLKPPLPGLPALLALPPLPALPTLPALLALFHHMILIIEVQLRQYGM